MQALDTLRDGIWSFVAAPVLALAAILLTVLLRAPQLTRFAEGWRAVFAHDPSAPGHLPPATATLLSFAATWGGAAAVAAATAVSLGGAGALAWLWLFGILLAPLRYAEVLLARSSPPGKAGGEARGSLGARLAGDRVSGVRAIGSALLALVPITAFAWFGGTHGAAVFDLAEQLLPGSGTPVGLAVALVAALTTGLVLGRGTAREVPVVVGWLALAALAALFAVAFVGLLDDPRIAMGCVPRALEDAFSGAEHVGAFSGALAGEVAAAGVLQLLPPLAATGGVDGAVHDAARAHTARGQASAALIGVFLHVVLATMLGFSFVVTGAFHRRVESERSLAELTLWRSAFDTVSQRRETSDRAFSGTVRVIEGEARARPLELATERGMVTSPRYFEHGQPADFALRVREGRATMMLVLDEHATLVPVPLERLRDVRVRGRMLPAGALLVATAMVRAGGEAASRIALVALLLLAAIGAAAWGLASARAVRGPLSIAAAFLPAAGLLLASLQIVPWLASAGAICAALLATAAALGVLAKGRELARWVSDSRPKG
jgi:AGCS family alanine or glycine:cation symporter